MSHAKGVFIQGLWNLPSLLRASFGKWVDLTLAAVLKGKQGPLPNAHVPEVNQGA